VKIDPLRVIEQRSILTVEEKVPLDCTSNPSVFDVISLLLSTIPTSRWRETTYFHSPQASMAPSQHDSVARG
jgi:hypothetical protein